MPTKTGLPSNRPEDQYVPIGTGAGKANYRDNYTPPQVPTKLLAERVPEVAPGFSTYGIWTGNFEEDLLTPPRGAPDGSYYDPETAQAAVDFIQRLFHFEGRWAGNNFRLTWWQERLIRYVWGWNDKDGLRLIRQVYLEIPRKNGKSMFAAAIALLLAYADGEAAPQVFFAASDKEQASISYNMARVLIEQDEELAASTIIYNGAKRMLIPATHGELKALSGKTPKLYGLNLHGLVFDELMVQQNRVLWDALTTAQGAREQPLIFAITTAGWNRNSIAYEQREYTRQISEGTLTDHTFLGVVYTVPEDADWTLPETWKAASPSLGETISLDYYEKKCQEAIGQPSAQNSFRTLMLCQWVGQANRVIPMVDWDESTSVDLPPLRGLRCHGGLDLSDTQDLSAFVLDFMDVPAEGFHVWLPFFFIPEDGLAEKGRQDKVDYETWVSQGWITAIPGSVIRYEYIRETIREAAELYEIKDINFDRWGAVQLSRDLEDDGFTMVKMGQGYASMSAPTKETLRLIADHKLITGDNPVLRWMADNVAGAMDPAGNLKLSKATSGSRIDGLVAGVMALDGQMRRGGKKKKSIYENFDPDSFYDDEAWKKRQEALA